MACVSGEMNCDGTCADLTSDFSHCGSCGTSCDTGAGEVCITSICGIDNDGDGFLSVASGGSDCNDDQDLVNPAATEVCNQIDDNCSGSADETFDLTSDNLNCGACGTACSSNESCYSSACSCDTGFEDCNGNPADGCEVLAGVAELGI